MTSREWHVDRSVVFDRDDHTCQRCDTTDDEAALSLFPVGDGPSADVDVIHERSLATVCLRCAAVLDGDSSAPGAESDDGPDLHTDELFPLVRETTRRQGSTVSDVASFASLTTALPAALAADDAAAGDDAAGEEPADEGPTDDSAAGEDETDDEAIDEDDAGNGATDEEAADGSAADENDADGQHLPPKGQEYLRTRRSILLAIEFVDHRLARLETAAGAAVTPDRDPLLTAFVETATTLQTELRDLVDLAELVVTALGRCHGCFEPLGDDTDATADTTSPPPQTCATCGLDHRDVSDWHRPESTAVDLERLFSATNDTLRDASATTEELTDRTTALATELVAE